jgi:hypothetical protein
MNCNFFIKDVLLSQLESDIDNCQFTSIKPRYFILQTMQALYFIDI